MTETAFQLNDIVCATVSSLANDYPIVSNDYPAFKLRSREISGIVDISLQMNGQILDVACDDEEKLQILDVAVEEPRRENIAIIKSRVPRCTTSDIRRMHERIRLGFRVEVEPIAADEEGVDGYEIILDGAERLVVLGERRH